MFGGYHGVGMNEGDDGGIRDFHITELQVHYKAMVEPKSLFPLRLRMPSAHQ